MVKMCALDIQSVLTFAETRYLTYRLIVGEVSDIQGIVYGYCLFTGWG